MKKHFLVVAFLVSMLIPVLIRPSSSVYPTGTTIYKPEKCWNGYNIPSKNLTPSKAQLFDMNGNVVHEWKGIIGSPYKILPGGYIMGAVDAIGFDRTPLLQLDWDGNIVWKFEKSDLVSYNGKEPEWRARQHHDYQREGNPVGYYVPGMDPLVDKGNTLINTFKNVNRPDIAPAVICDTRIIDVTWEGDIIWDWLLTDHWDELGLSEAAKNAYYRFPGYNEDLGCAQKLFFNNINWLGPNRWYDAGDQRFHPENIIADSPLLNIIVIISRKTGEIVWRVGPEYTSTPALKKLGQMMYLHHAHIIPKGLPGAGNILVFDSGGQSGLGAPNPNSLTGVFNTARHWSRIVEFNPITLEIVWGYSAVDGGVRMPLLKGFGAYKSGGDHRFFSYNMGSAQRLPNGNTLITESQYGRVFEVTPEGEIVWEFIHPEDGKVYRTYRIPYDWIPQLERPIEKAVIPPPNKEFRIAPVGDNRNPSKETKIHTGIYRSRSKEE